VLKTYTYDIVPVPKPRMTQSDKWRKRPQCQKYWNFCDECRFAKVTFISGDIVQFVLPMPKSWSKKKREVMNGKPHKQTLDLDNLIKALGDALYENDSVLDNYCASKIWGNEGKIIIHRETED
jgi:Holliday junction resolvase RusA-like endonuclease